MTQEKRKRKRKEKRRENDRPSPVQNCFVDFDPSGESVASIAVRTACSRYTEASDIVKDSRWLETFSQRQRSSGRRGSVLEIGIIGYTLGIYTRPSHWHTTGFRNPDD